MAIRDGDKLDQSQKLKLRTKGFSLRVIRLFKALPKTDEARIIGRQLLRSGTAIGANYRAACRARTSREFVAKMRIVVEEADEAAHWIELLIRRNRRGTADEVTASGSERARCDLRSVSTHR